MSELTETPRRTAFTSGHGHSPVVLHPRQSRPGTSIGAVALQGAVGQLALIITAAVAMSGITGDVAEARSHLEQRLAAVTARAGI